MVMTLSDWRYKVFQMKEQWTDDQLYHEKFFRDPERKIIDDESKIYSPADGTIIYCKYIDKSDDIIAEVKGINYSLDDITGGKLTNRDLSYYVVGIFMTLYDVHVNRMPMGGKLSYEFLPPIDSYNVPMVHMEKGIFSGIVDWNKDHSYLKKNARMFNTVKTDSLILPQYHIVQFADYEVDVICPFTQIQDTEMFQGQRFSQIRWGSQVDLIIPMTRESEDSISPVIYDQYTHVEAGLDPLFNFVS